MVLASDEKNNKSEGKDIVYFIYTSARLTYFSSITVI